MVNLYLIKLTVISLLKNNEMLYKLFDKQVVTEEGVMNESETTIIVDDDGLLKSLNTNYLIMLLNYCELPEKNRTND